VLKCEDEVAFSAGKENEVIRCLRFEVVLDLGENDTAEDRLEKIVRERRKEQRSRMKPSSCRLFNTYVESLSDRDMMK